MSNGPLDGGLSRRRRPPGMAPRCPRAGGTDAVPAIHVPIRDVDRPERCGLQIGSGRGEPCDGVAGEKPENTSIGLRSPRRLRVVSRHDTAARGFMPEVRPEKG